MFDVGVSRKEEGLDAPSGVWAWVVDVGRLVCEGQVVVDAGV